MDWNDICRISLLKGGCLTEYAYLGTDEGMMADHDRRGGFQTFTKYEAFIIANSNCSSFQIRGENYRLVERENNIHTYESITRTIVCGKHSQFVIIVSACCYYQVSRVRNACQKSVICGLEYIKAIENC
ncbi:uncharacterized protein LOC143452568 [Clavelina lepadiformis]|uniref:Profilin n=1 Tax=Clavelina lepadiformis TaxID=159417 RepID=A0ABP0GKE3_CLALP